MTVQLGNPRGNFDKWALDSFRKIEQWIRAQTAGSTAFNDESSVLGVRNVQEAIDALATGVGASQPLDATLTALAGLNTTPGVVVQTGTDTFTKRTLAATGLAVMTNGDGVAAAPSVAVTAASQSDQETGTSTTVAVTPGVQHSHPSAAKCWANVSVSGGTPTLDQSFNITSITDTATGQLTVTIATDFANNDWAGFGTVNKGGNGGYVHINNVATGSCLCLCRDDTGALADPVHWYFVGFGDQ